MSILQKIANLVLDLLFPPVCFGCKGEGEWLCLECRKIYLSKPLVWRVVGKSRLRVVSLAKYTDEGIKFAVHSLKFQSVKRYGDRLGELLAQKLPRGYFKDAVLVPIPLRKYKQRERGFNQSHVIALAIAKHTGCQVVEALEKIKATPSQVEMENKKDRLVNIKGSFALSCQKEIICGKNIILVDDVITTGATFGEAAKVLRQAKPQSIRAMTAASD